MTNVYGLKPGDVVFFCGRGWKSRLIAFLTMPRYVWLLAVVAAYFGFVHGWRVVLSALAIVLGVSWSFQSPKISHVGVVAPWKGRALMFESTTLCKDPCAIKGVVVKGVQAHNVTDRIGSYDGQVWVAKLKYELDDSDEAKMQSFCAQWIGTDYKYGAALLSGTKLAKYILAPWQRHVHGFCSDFAAGLLKRPRLFPLGYRSAWIHPALLWRLLGNTDLYGFARLK